MPMGLASLIFSWRSASPLASGDAVSLAAWYRGYGWAHHATAARDQHQIMARAMLYYPDDFARLIQTIPGATQCQDWYAMAVAFWQLAAA